MSEPGDSVWCLVLRWPDAGAIMKMILWRGNDDVDDMWRVTGHSDNAN